MSVGGVVRKDLLDVRRSNLIRGVVFLLVAFNVLFFWGTGSTGDPDIYDSLNLMAVFAILLVPLIALLSSYLSVAGERQNGNLKFLLSYPNSRRDVVIGKLLARSTIIVLSLGIAYSVGFALALYYYQEVFVSDFIAYIELTLLYALTYVSIGVAISAATASRARAMAASIGVWFVLNVFWNFLPINPSLVVAYFADKVDLVLEPEVYEFIWRLSPTGAYLSSMELVFPDSFARQQGNTLWLSSNNPFYLEGWFTIVIMAFWIVVPLAIGYWRFNRADLG